MSFFLRTPNRTASLVSIAVLGAFAAGYVIFSYDYEPKVRAFPHIVGFAMLVFVALDLIGHTDTALGRLVGTLVGMERPKERAEPGTAEGSPIGALLWIPAYGVLVYLFGFLVTVGLYMFVSMAVFGKSSPLWAALWSAVLVVVVYVFFEVALGFRLFAGIVLGPLIAG